MTKTNALPRPVGATVLFLLVLTLAALALPATGLAAPAAESDPVLTISPAPAVVPTTTVGNQSQTVEFELDNESGEEASIEKVTLEGEDAAEFNFGGSSCGTLEPGEHCVAWVGLHPNSVGTKRTTLYVRFAGGRPEQGFEVSGAAVPAHFSFQPGSYDFGLQPIHSESRRTSFQIVNDGEAAAQVGSLNFVGGNSNGFWFGNSDCWGRWMQPSETCSLEVDFGPGEVGAFATQIQLNANGENFSADVSGEGGRAIVEATPNPANFGAATVGSTGAAQTIVISNSGNVPTGFFIGIVAGGDAGSFKLLDENCTAAPLMPGGTCTAHIRFAPQTPGPKAARLAFFGEGEGGTMVALTGEGVAPAVTLAPSAFDFGSQAAGEKSAAHAFAVRNDGEAPLDLDGVAIVGADPDQFGLAGDECTGARLVPGAECLVRVRFAPDSAGAKAATLRVHGDAGVFTASLAGTGSGSSVGTEAGKNPVPAGTPGAAGNAVPPSRLGRHRGKHRRFSRGGAVTSTVRGRHPRRGALRASTVPR